MRYFISTLSFSGLVDPPQMKPVFAVQLLSLTLTKEDGESITLLSKEFNPSKISDACLDTFLEEGKFVGSGWATESKVSKANSIQDLAGKTYGQMKKSIREFIGFGGSYIYGYQPWEDFVLLRMLIGPLKGMYTHDLKQMDDYISAAVNDDFWVGEDDNYPIPNWVGEIECSASKSKWCKSLYDFLIKFKTENNIK